MLAITGATGNSGTHLIRELEKNGFGGRVRCLARTGADTSALVKSPLNPEVFEGELTDAAFLDRALRGVDTVMHIASIKFSQEIVKAALNNNVRRIVLVHTTGVYSKYKSAADEYIEIERRLQVLLASSPERIEVVILRPTMIFGQPRDRNMSTFIRLVDKFNWIPVIDQGKSLLQPVHGSDLGRAYRQIIESQELPRSTYVLSGERPVTMREMLSTIAAYLGKDVHLISVPLPIGILAARIVRFASLGRVNMVERVQRMGENRSFSHEQAREDFRYCPSPFFENLKREVELYKSKRGGQK